MRRLSLHIILFLLPVLLFILLFPQDKRQVYASLKDDCTSRAHWMYQRIFESSEPVDIAFMGSSRTINSLKEKVIRTELDGYHLLNYGYCRYGRNLHYRLVKDLIDEKGIKALVLEVRLDENPYSHPVGPYLLENSDLITSYPFFNQNYFKDWSTAFRFRLQMLKEKLWRHEDRLIATNARFGFPQTSLLPSPPYTKGKKASAELKKKIVLSGNWKMCIPCTTSAELPRFVPIIMLTCIFYTCPAMVFPIRSLTKLNFTKSWGSSLYLLIPFWKMLNCGPTLIT